MQFKDVMILRSLRHHTEEEVEGYRLHSRLTIHQVTKKKNPPGDQLDVNKQVRLRIGSYALCSVFLGDQV